MKLYRNVVKILGQDRILITCNHHENNQQKWTKTIGNFHHIHMIDRSGSMMGSIAELIEDLIVTLTIMSPEDIVTVVWFASTHEQGIIVKGAKNDPKLKDILRNYKSVLGTTCFSKPMEMVKSIIDELSPMCENTIVNFFTDGMPVVPWSAESEYVKTLEIVKSFQNKIMAFNSIGYGQYYSQDFLKSLAGCSEYGQFVHASEIREYQKIFDMNYRIVKENVLEKVHIKAPGHITYLNRKMTKSEYDEMKLNSLDNNKNQFFILLPKDSAIEINTEFFETDKIKEQCADATIQNFFYAYAYNMFNNNMRGEALQVIVKSIGNGYLADRQLNAWTFDEVSAYQKTLFDRLMNPENRKTDSKCKANYLPKDDAFCFMDLVKLLVRDGASYLPYHKSADSYERIGKETNHSEFTFQANKEEVRGSFTELVFNKERCNIGIKFAINGIVPLKDEDKTKKRDHLKSVIFRTHNIILDGYPNIKNLMVIVGEKLFNYLENKKVDMEVVEDHDIAKIVKINLCSIPVINRKMAVGVTGNDILKLMEDLLTQESEIKVIEHLLKSKGKQTSQTHIEYSDADKQLMEKYGIDSSGCYRGLGESRKQNDDCDYYVSKNVSFALKGFATIPSVNEYLKRLAEKKDVTKGAISYIHKAFQSVGDMNVSQLEEELMAWKESVAELKLEVAKIKMSVILTGSWISNFKTNDKGEFVYEGKTGTAVMNIKEAKQYF